MTRCTVNRSGKVTLDTSSSYSLLLNPASIAHNRTIAYNNTPTQGQTASESKFSRFEPDTLDFDVVLDGTGVVTRSGGMEESVVSQVDGLSSVLYQYNGTNHEPNRLRLLWGTFIFFGRVKSFNLTYTLFKPGGEPLRAKLKLSFVGFMSKQEMRLSANRSSPDLSHVVEVKAGDTLPLLCERIYGDCRYYAEVAKFNGLRQFRTLKPGLKLHFPPLES